MDSPCAGSQGSAAGVRGEVEVEERDSAVGLGH